MQIEMTNKRWGLLAVFVLVVALAIYASWPPTTKPADATAAINAAVEAAKKPLLAQLKEKDAELTDYKSRLDVSEGKYSTLSAKYIKLQKEKIDVKPPVTNIELRARFTALGYPPLPVK
jgi:hypothetical protein